MISWKENGFVGFILFFFNILKVKLVIAALPLRWILLLLFPILSHQTSSGLFSVKVQSPVSEQLGSSAFLHCAVKDNMDARALEVRWYRPKMYDSPVLFYDNGQIQKSPVDVQYEGRVFLLGELEKGDVSLKLENLTLADRGDYKCHVSSDDWFDEATISLRVRVAGSTPVLASHVEGSGQMKISCQSRDWLPEPSIIWTDKDGRDLKHLSKDKFTNSSEGFVDVSSWLIVSPSESEWISCSVGLSDQERKESRIMLNIHACVTESFNGYIIVISILLLLLCAAGIAVYCVLHKKVLILSKRNGTENTGGNPSEIEPLNKIHVENQDQIDASSSSSSTSTSSSSSISPTDQNSTKSSGKHAANIIKPTATIPDSTSAAIISSPTTTASTSEPTPTTSISNHEPVQTESWRCVVS